MYSNFFYNAAISVSLERAVEIFDTLAANKDIAFAHPEGCYARAELMCHELFDMNVTPKRAWAFKGESQLRNIRADGKTIAWGFHVAPALSVAMPDGKTQDLVLDPSLFDGPVTLQDWARGMKAGDDPLSLQVVGYREVPAGKAGNFTPENYLDHRTTAYSKDLMKELVSQQDHTHLLIKSPLRGLRHPPVPVPSAPDLKK